MGNINLKLNFAPGLLAYSNSQTDVQSNNIVVGVAGSWYAEKIVFNQDTTINKLGFTIGVLSGISTCLVGITTSLGPYGLYPYTIDNVAGSAASLGFSVIAGAFTTNSQSNSFREVSLLNDFTCLKDVPYWLGIVSLGKPTAASNFNFFGSTDETLLTRGHQGSVNMVGTGVISGATQNILVPGYNSGSGKTSYYPKGHFLWDDSFTGAGNFFTHKATSYYEFGGRFELNEIQSQQLELSYVQYGTIYPVDGDIEYTCKLYDHKHNIVGTAITERPNLASGTLTDRGTFTFYFVPKIKINPDFPYYLTFTATGGTACSSVHRVITKSGNDNMRSQSTHYIDYIERTASGVAFSEDTIFRSDDQKYTPTISLGITDFISMRRGGGN